MGRSKHYEPGDEVSSRWAEYVERWLTATGQSSADLARATGIGESQVSRWRRGATVPDVISCRKVAKALKRPLLEVLVAAGHLTVAEANNTKPAVPPKAPYQSAQLARLQAVLDDPKTPKVTRDRLQMLIDMATETADSAPKSGRSSA